MPMCSAGIYVWLAVYMCVLVWDFIWSTPCSYDGKVENYRVRRNDKGLVTVDDDEYFDNPVELVEVSDLR